MNYKSSRRFTSGMRFKTIIGILIMVVLPIVGHPQNVHALSTDVVPGNLDTSFDNDGKVTTLVGPQDNFGEDVAIQGDGKIVVVGRADPGIDTGQDNFALVRYNPNGSLDTDFDGGKVTTDIANGFDSGKAIAVQPDGKLVVAGYAYPPPTQCFTPTCYMFALARYYVNGTLDTAFGMNGVAETQVSPMNDIPTDLAIQSDGKIVVVGYTENPGHPADSNFALVRYNPDGSPDNSFGVNANSTVITNMSNSTSEQAETLAVQRDGKILVAGFASDQFALARYNANGILDDAFGDHGKVITNMAGGSSDTSSAEGIALLADGKILVGGSAAGSKSGIALARYLPDGKLDSSFGSSGRVITDIGTGARSVSDLAVQPDGKIVVVADDYVSSNFALARYLPDGRQDASFGSFGRVLDLFGRARAVALQTDGRIVVAGWAEGGFCPGMARRCIAVARYLGDSADLAVTMTDSPDPAFVRSNLTYTIRLANNGYSPASDVVVWASLSTNVTLLIFRSAQGTCNGPSFVKCDLGTVRNPANLTIEIVVRPGSTGTLSGTVMVNSTTPDPDPANNRAAQSTTVLEKPPSIAGLPLPAIVITPLSIIFGVAIFLTRFKSKRKTAGLGATGKLIRGLNLGGGKYFHGLS